MPAFVPTLQKSFKLTLKDGLPQAAIEKVGEAHLIRCCPLCGCSHQLMSLDDQSKYKPLCQTMPNLFKLQQVSWHKLYPDMAQYSSLNLIVSK
jgi:hypothetical protein